jgi:hypothetical protein
LGFLDLFRGQRKNPQKPPDIPIAHDDTGETIYSDDIISEILSELERRRSERTPYELKWTLNSNFLAGHQNCDIDTLTNVVVTENPVENLDKERRVYNRIAPLMETRDANLGSVKYDMVVNPRTNESDDVAKANVSTKLLQYSQSMVDFQRKQAQIRRWAEVCGTSFSISWGDKNAGEKVGVEIAEYESVDANGNTIIAQKSTDIYSGELSMGVLTAYEVFPHSLIIENICDQHDIIIEQVLDVEQIKDRYGIAVDGESVETYIMSPLPNAVTGHGRNNVAFGINKATRNDCAKVITYLENPTKSHPRGRTIIIVKDQIVYYGELPAGTMNIVAYKAKNVPGMFYGKSVIEDLIPLQRTYNSVINKIIDNVSTIANNPILAPVGSIDIDAIEAHGGIDSGSIVEYEPSRGKPEFWQYPNPPGVVFDMRKHIEESMEYTAGVSQLMVYGAAAASSSGKALDTRREIDMTRMSMTADNLRDGVISMAKIWLALNKTYSSGYRVINVAGKDDISSVYTWSADDINSFDVEFAAENELRHSKEQQKQDFMEALQLGLFTDESGRVSQDVKRRAWELFRIGNFDNIMEIDDMQRKNAERENAYLESGVIPKRFKYDDDEIHIRQHMTFALSTDFRTLMNTSPEYAKMFDAHIEEHKAVLREKANAQKAEMLALSQNNINKGV